MLCLPQSLALLGHRGGAHIYTFYCCLYLSCECWLDGMDYSCSWCNGLSRILERPSSHYTPPLMVFGGMKLLERIQGTRPVL